MEQYFIEDYIRFDKATGANDIPTKKRIIIKKGAEYVVLKLEDVLLFYTENKIVYLLDRSLVKYMAERSLSDLESSLNAAMFFRANRKYILNINYIRSYKSFEKVKLLVEFIIPDVTHKIIVSQETAPLFKKWIAGY